MLMDNLGADRCVYRHRDAELVGSHQQRELCVCEIGTSGECA